MQVLFTTEKCAYFKMVFISSEKKITKTVNSSLILQYIFLSLKHKTLWIWRSPDISWWSVEWIQRTWLIERHAHERKLHDSSAEENVSGLIDSKQRSKRSEPCGSFPVFPREMERKHLKIANNTFIMCLLKLFTCEYDKIRGGDEKETLRGSVATERT